MKIHRSPLVAALAAVLCLGSGAHAAPRTSGNPSAGAKPRLSEAQLAEAQARAELANEIVRNVSADAKAKGLDDSWRVNMLSLLYGTQSGALRDIRSAARTLDEVHAQAAQARSRADASAAGRASPGEAGAASLGSFTDSLVFNPVTPCRFIDTRVLGGPINASARVFSVDEHGSAYGGAASCFVGVEQPAIAANITIVNPSIAAGHLGIRPAGSTNVTSWLNWYQANEVTANAGVVTTSQSAPFGDMFEMLTGSGTVNVVFDYFGYFTAPGTTSLVCGAGAGQLIDLPAGFNNTRFAEAVSCPVNMTPVSALCYNNGTSGVTLGGFGVNTNPWCNWNNQTASTATVFQNVFCCQIP